MERLTASHHLATSVTLLMQPMAAALTCLTTAAHVASAMTVTLSAVFVTEQQLEHRLV
jgi:hypothetical protein